LAELYCAERLPPAPTVTVIGVPAVTANPDAVLKPPAPPPPVGFELSSVLALPPPPATTRYSTVGVAKVLVTELLAELAADCPLA
jgi:hypothetical protein